MTNNVNNTLDISLNELLPRKSRETFKEYKNYKGNSLFSEAFKECDASTFSPYAKCSYRCVYCSVEAQGQSKPIFSREELPTEFKKQYDTLAHKRTIIIGTQSDAYPPEEEHYQLMREVIPVLNELQQSFRIVTKGHLIERDIDLLSGNPLCDMVMISLLTDDDNILQKYDPGAPLFERRKKSVETLRQAGVKTRISLSPWVPGVSDIESMMRHFPDVTISVGALDLDGCLGSEWSSANKVFGDVMSQADINRQYLQEFARLRHHEQLTWNIPPGWIRYRNEKGNPINCFTRLTPDLIQHIEQNYEHNQIPTVSLR